MLKSIIIIFTVSVVSVTSVYADMSEAKELFDNGKCIQCHSTKEFKPRKNKVNSFKKLYTIVRKCSHNNDTGWFDDEAMDVAKYLNKNFYHFKEED